MSDAVQIIESAHFINRELSWLEFNQRVLDEARHAGNPLLERLKFFCITSSNLDEFFEVRVARLKEEIESGAMVRGPDGLNPAETLRAVHRRITRLVRDQYHCWRAQLAPALAHRGICFLDPRRLNAEDTRYLENFFRDQVLPVLTPLAIDPVHPFPLLLNKSLNIIVQLEKKTGREHLRHLAVVQVPRVLPAVVKLPREGPRRDYVFLGDVVGCFLKEIFPGTKMLGHWHFRVTRNSELYLDEHESDSLRKAVENELHNRRKGAAVRLEVDQQCPEKIRRALLGTLRLTADDMTLVDGPVNAGRLMAIYDGDHSSELRDPPFQAPIPVALRGEEDIFSAVREGDILLHHPYDNFNVVVGFLEKSARDPNVLAIKQTLYRTGGDTRIVGALMEAAQSGKQVTVVVELRARFDEANNIQWSRALERAGVHVVYGVVGFKIHCKICLVVRRDHDGIRRYVHLSTGNYNPTTARLYTDMGLLTCRADFGEDATNVFNLLTGIGHFGAGRKIVLSPFRLHRRILALIEREAENARRGRPARIIAKMNALSEKEVIEALYRASQAGVKIDLLVRGICCLRPGVNGLSNNITVRSIVDRFLEHSRIFYFGNGGEPEIFLGSADWMPRNFFRRVETLFPVEDPALRCRIEKEMLGIPLADEARAWLLRKDGSYRRASSGKKSGLRSQLEFIRLALQASPRSARRRLVPA